ncbi:MAG: 2-hydroxyacyl-CoA dehydratase [Chloroflexi bacterium]|nr:2-hydroxyacyl-CoA dehydratase [Chloroflexota bacterium]
MNRFREVLQNHHQYARDWRAKTGGKVIGYFCPYLPEEIVYAAGVLPVRLLAEHEPDDVSDRYMFDTCRVSKDLLNQVMKGRYDYLDGAINQEGCQWLRHVYASWQLHKPSSYTHYIFFPDYIDGWRAKTLLRNELEFFKKSLEGWTGKTITDQALDNAIEIYDTNRRLLRQLYELRRANTPLIWGTEAMEMVLAGQVMDKAEHNRLLTEALKDVWGRKNVEKPKVRLMLVGSDTHDTALEELVDSLGGTFVIDEVCNGSSYFWNETVHQPDRLMAISMRYLDKPNCPIKDIYYAHRPERIASLVEDYNVQGIIIAKQKSCHPHGTDNPLIWKMLRDRVIPFLYFESDMVSSGGENRTRIEAFMESLVPEHVQVEAGVGAGMSGTDMMGSDEG